MSLESYVLEIIEGKRSAPVTAFFLSGLSILYKAAITFRHFAYDNVLIRSYEAPVPVVSVGNIVTGGVGKTPVVRMLAEELSKTRKVAILTRGYRSKVERSKKTLRWSGQSADVCGDEPAWLGMKLPQVDVWIGKKRAILAALACRDGAEVLILDDGMQHRALLRNADIVVMNCEDLWGGGKFLPRGHLRDLPKRLSVARLIVMTQVIDPKDIERLRPQIERYTKAPIVGMALKIDEKLRGKKVGLFCAIGKPERFLRSVQEIGADVVSEMIGLDHVPFERHKLEDFAKLCREKGADRLVCTEKDGVKLPTDLKSCLPISALKARLEIVAGEEHWNHLIKELSHDRRI